MFIDIDDIKESVLSRSYSKTFNDFPVLEEMVNAGECDFISPIDIKLNVKRNINVIEVTGNIETKARIQCGRCVEKYETFIGPAFSLTFVPEEGEDPDGLLDDEIELSTDDMQVVNFSGGMIELKDSVQEQLILAFPVKPLCRESCKGLCSNCGANLNDMKCDCENEYINPQFAALKNLKIDK
ncbi:MAG: DUF177 domain-containing protein [Desulfobacterales bacterium]|jgi:uncharacterized protein|nr:DUF177 domain-containing protein [Desulfobacteraceae bacterium]MBT4363067.1 DUF177 domain-containing protein [Desulfobacteraceae bacterium]MBT7084873.1 DUF177 domain-containing protein [Desulfobacterales bacterium]MBT7698271.1 DUF177 domain-containing protein [Desulfobacterales bacterium]